MKHTTSSLYEEIEDFIRVGEDDEQRFNALAVDLFRQQLQCNGLYTNYVQELGVNPEHIDDWRMIPALPQLAFKLGRVACFGEDETIRTFLTSGTTGEKRGSHPFRTMTYYDLAIRQGWKLLGIPPLPLHILIPSPSDRRDSSLAHMMGVLAEIAPSAKFYSGPDGSVEHARFLGQIGESATPVALLGTAIGLLHCCQWMGKEDIDIRLPEGSIILETGGYKGLRESMEKREFYSMLTSKFGVPDHSIINEYGMTELSSQFYARGKDGTHTNQPWAKVSVVSPENSMECAVGETGLVRIVDLANVDSCLAIQTRDFAEKSQTGFQLLGRDPGALPRGCSRAVQT